MARSPRRSKRRVYWDSCSWLGLIWNETVRLKDGTVEIRLKDGTVENRGALCRAVIDDATKGGADIFTSALTLVEVNKHPDLNPQSGADKLKNFFENDYIVVVAMDRRVGEVGRELMWRRFSKLKPPDAVHLASAIVADVEELHTFDDDLLSLEGRVQRADGTDLKICKPSMGGSPLPLLESPAETEAADDTGSNSEENQGDGQPEPTDEVRAEILSLRPDAPLATAEPNKLDDAGVNAVPTITEPRGNSSPVEGQPDSNAAPQPD